MQEVLAQKPTRKSPLVYVAWTLRIGAGLYLAILLIMIASETRLMFPGADETIGDWTHADVQLEEVEIESKDGTKLIGHYLPNTKSQRYLLFCHGNAENVATIDHDLDMLRKTLDVSVFAIDYRGYGRSKGTPSEEKLLEDGEAALEWLTKRAIQPPTELIVMGRSLGGAVAVHLAARYDTEALILDRTFSSAVDVAADTYWWLPIKYVMRNQFWSVVKIKLYEGPVFQLHGEADEVVPFWSGEKLFRASPSEDKFSTMRKD